MLKNAYLGAKIGFDTAANELSKVGCAASYQLYLYLLSRTQITLQTAISFAFISGNGCPSGNIRHKQ